MCTSPNWIPPSIWTILQQRFQSPLLRLLALCYHQARFHGCDIGYAWIWWNSIAEFSKVSVHSVHLRFEICILNAKQELMSFVSGLSSFGFGGTNAHVTCKSSETAVETKVESGSKLRPPKSTKYPRKSKPNSKQIHENLITWSTWCVWYVWWKLLVRWPAKSEQPSFSQGRAHSVLAWGKSSMPLRTGLNQPAPPFLFEKHMAWMRNLRCSKKTSVVYNIFKRWWVFGCFRK